MIRLSASFIKDYLSCYRKGFYRIQSPEEAVQNDDMIVGTIIHKVLENKWNTSYSEANKYANYLVTKYNISDPNPLRMGKISRSLRNYFNDFSSLLSKEDIIESFFKIPYKDSSDVLMTGKFDRITKDGLIIDWKSELTTPASISGDIQFIIYYETYKKIYKKEPKKVLNVSLVNGKVVEFIPDEYYITELYDKVIPDIISNIKAGNTSRTGLYSGACYSCQFNGICFKELKGL